MEGLIFQQSSLCWSLAILVPSAVDWDLLINYGYSARRRIGIKYTSAVNVFWPPPEVNDCIEVWLSL